METKSRQWLNSKHGSALSPSGQKGCGLDSPEAVPFSVDFAGSATFSHSSFPFQFRFWQNASTVLVGVTLNNHQHKMHLNEFVIKHKPQTQVSLFYCLGFARLDFQFLFQISKILFCLPVD